MNRAADTLFWLTSAGSDLLKRTALLAEELNFDAPATALRLKKLHPEISPTDLNRALDIVAARHKAAPRLGAWTAHALLTTRSVEQASRPAIARRHAERFAGCRRVLEIGTGSGFDTAALAKTAQRVTSLEPDPELAAMARFNLELQGITNVEILAQSLEDFIACTDLACFDGFFADPSRRDDAGTRIRSGDDYRPALSAVIALPITGIRGIKISPALDVELPPGWTHEFIGFEGECLEQTLWSGADAPPRGVFLADANITFTSASSADVDAAAIDEPLNGFIFDPHPALVRSRCLDAFYAANQLQRLDPACPYGIGPSAVSSPFVQSFQILEVLPYRIKDLAAKLSERRWNSRTEIKKRGVDEDPDEVRKKLKLPKPSSAAEPYGVVLLARRGPGTIAILAERTAPRNEAAP